MHHTILILFALAAMSMGIIISQPKLEQRERQLNTGPYCLSYTDPRVILFNQGLVTQQYSGNSAALSQLELTNCLNDYGCGRFSDSWDGNVCGGRGWFKGPPDSKTSNSECYQILAPWVLLNGIQSGSGYYKAMLGKHCYMGYNDPGSD